MQYDPIKKSLGLFFNRSPLLRILFYRLLNLLLLRAWYIRKELRKCRKERAGSISVLDAGSGFGQYTWSMMKLSDKWKITGIDVKSEQIDDCNEFIRKIKKEGQVEFREGDLTIMNEERAYDLILCVDVMEHIENDLLVLKNFRRALRPGGQLIISTPSDQGGSDVHGGQTESFIEEHIRDGYNINDIREKLRSAGFDQVDAKYSYGVPGKISWKLSMKYPILMLGSSKLFYLVLTFYYILIFPVALILNFLDVSFSHQSGTGLIVRAGVNR
jgi:SAM-dependent methyltransferase